MQINKTSSSQNFGMTIKAPESFLNTINHEMHDYSNRGKLTKLYNNIGKIVNTRTYDMYEIKEVVQTSKKGSLEKLIKNGLLEAFNEVPENTVKVGYRLIDKTKNTVVLEEIINQKNKLFFNKEITPVKFIHYIAKNLKKIKNLENHFSL